MSKKSNEVFFPLLAFVFMAVFYSIAACAVRKPTRHHMVFEENLSRITEIKRDREIRCFLRELEMCNAKEKRCLQYDRKPAGRCDTEKKLCVEEIGELYCFNSS